MVIGKRLNDYIKSALNNNPQNEIVDYSKRQNSLWMNIKNKKSF